ncbi:hypothetical protein BBJ28_00006656 [Nothophytophthora sp. Chile5]|nr:hypothetical protein BBJ28_00006656 [Nothophytophthora sp. Chile5]
MGSFVTKYLKLAWATIFGRPAEKGAEQPTMTTQSPIDIVDEDSANVVALDPRKVALRFGSAPAEIELVHKGANFQVNWSDHTQNVLTLNGKKYYTVQFHFHAPSTLCFACLPASHSCSTRAHMCLFVSPCSSVIGEHTVNGNARAMELHLVHQSEDGDLAVVGVFFREGKESAFLAQFWDEIASLAPEKHDHVNVGKISGGADLNSLLKGKIFRYTGSLTTPPYSEGVEWIVVREMLEASPAQLELYRKFLPSPNARDVQKLNGRGVSLCQCTAPMGA